jgi:hypothetical protein
MKIKHSILAGLAGLVAGIAVLGSASDATAQEIQITGPLAGAKAVRRLRLHRDRRFDIAPSPCLTSFVATRSSAHA